MPTSKTKTANETAAAQEIETEICLSGPFSLALLRKSPWLCETRPTRQMLRAVYFDTPKADIARAGAGLRIRRESGTWVQTLKIETASASRFESNYILRQKTLQPFPTIAKEGLPAAASLKRYRLGRATAQALKDPTGLRPVFEIRVTRYQWLLRYEDSDIAVAFDLGSVQPPLGESSGRPATASPSPGEDALAINELELELVAGSARALWRLATELLGWLPSSGFGLEPRSKAERGFVWAYPALTGTDSQRSRPKSPRSQAPSDPSLGTVLRHHLQAALTTLSQRLVQVQVRIEPEDTHQSRVALRQIRTLLKLLVAAGYPDPAQRLLPQCAELADALGSLRDLDVVMEMLIAPLLEKLPRDPALKALATAVAQYRAALRKTLRQQLTERDTPMLLCALGQLSEEIPDAPLSSSSEAFARSEARRLRKRIRRREQRCRSEPSVEADHRLRLAHKALRYACPLLQDLNAPQDLKAWAKASAKAQEALGLAQDRATARNTIANALQASPMDTAMQARALAIIEGFLLAQQ